MEDEVVIDVVDIVCSGVEDTDEFDAVVGAGVDELDV